MLKYYQYFLYYKRKFLLKLTGKYLDILLAWKIIKIERILRKEDKKNKSKSFIYLDKNKEKLSHGDFIYWNPDDDEWLDVIIELGHSGILTSMYELGGGELKLKDSLFGSNNPVLKIGNIYTHQVELTNYNDL